MNESSRPGSEPPAGMRARGRSHAPPPQDGATARGEARSAGALASIQEAQRAKSRVEQLLDAIRAHAGGKHLVVIRGYPDPDSLASAWAHARLAASVGVECEIAHLPLVSRAENRAMVNLLDLPLTRLAGPQDLERYSAMSLV